MSKRKVLSRIRRITKYVLIAGLYTASASLSADAQTVQVDAQTRLVKHQSRDIEFPEDYMARVDVNKMQVSLVALGLDGGKLQTSNLLVSLLTPNGEERTATSDSQGMVTFDVDQNDLDDVGAIIVPDQNAHAVLPVIPTSSKIADARNLPKKNFVLPLMPANRDEITASIVRGTLPSSNSSGELFSSNEYKLRSGNPFSVRLQRDGRLLGRVVVIDRSLAENLRFAKLTFLRGNQVVARTESNPVEGSFVVPRLAVGTYGVIASGPAGYSAFSFEVLPPLGIDRIGVAIEGRPISFVQPDSNDRLYVFLCPPKYVARISERCREVYSRPIADVAGAQPVSGLTFGSSPGLASAGGYNGGGFGSSGGGGFGGGIGGLGSLAAIAGLATVGGIVAANDNNNNTTTVSPISP